MTPKPKPFHKRGYREDLLRSVDVATGFKLNTYKTSPKGPVPP